MAPETYQIKMSFYELRRQGKQRAALCVSTGAATVCPVFIHTKTFFSIASVSIHL